MNSAVHIIFLSSRYRSFLNIRKHWCGTQSSCHFSINQSYEDVTNTFISTSGTGNTYVWISERMTWDEAQSFCRAKHTDLTSVRNETELQQILRITQGFDVWIGLYRNLLWSDQSNSTFSYWRPAIQQHIIAEPDNGLYSFAQYGDQHCTAMDSTGKWTDENCLASFPFFCYSSEFISFQWNNKNFKYFLFYVRIYCI